MDRGILDDGRKPSRWNKCRFQCAICHKLSSEKRHVREHIIKVHGLSLNDYEAQYGECEIHTEYFFCGICHAEVKHNLKNIALHLNNVHNINPQAYEAQFGRISDEEVQIPEAANSASAAGSSAGIGLAGSHFLMADDSVETNGKSPTSAARKTPNAALQNPSKSDIINPKNKYCRPCNRDFNRRQAFVEHCRTVHKLKLKFKRPQSTPSQSSPNVTIPPAPVTPTPAPPATPSSPVTPGMGYSCDFCGKLFSNRSNRTRHVVLSCDAAKLQKSSQPRRDSQSDSDDYPTKVAREPIKCPFPECDVIHLRTALMKRHLCEAHNIQNVSVTLPENADSVKDEPAEFVIEGESVTQEVGDEIIESETGTSPGNESSEKRVPPIRVKLHGTLNSPESSPRASVVPATKPVASIPANDKSNPSLACKFCGSYTAKNAYLLSRHKKACLKRRRLQKRKAQEAANAEAEAEAAADADADVDADADTTAHGDATAEGDEIADELVDASVNQGVNGDDAVVDAVVEDGATNEAMETE